jgi:eukaryotic-like serine/threonine-protein kinase
MPILTPEERLGQLVAHRYRLDAVLSIGGMGVLFEADDEVTGTRVALKMLKPAYALEPDRVARFDRETRIATRLRHRNIAAVLDVGVSDDGVPLLVMELLEGQSLAEELERRHILPVGEALAIGVAVADALIAAHALGVLHRDVKPGNIFLARDGDGKDGKTVPKLLDFGIAVSPHDDFATQTGHVLGTPGYMAPEQAQHGECGPFTDVWGVGAVLYRCLMGHPPHSAESVPEVLRKLVRDPVPPVTAQGASKSLCATIDRALAREPHRRYQSMEAFARALASAGTRREEEATTVVTPMSEARTEEMTVPAFESLTVPRAFSSEMPASGEKARWRSRPLRASTWLGAALVSGGLLVVDARLDRTREVTSSATAPVPPSRPADRSLTGVEPATFESESDPAGRSRSEAISVESAPSSPPTLAASSLMHEERRGQSPSPAVRSNPRPRSHFEREPATGLPVATEW